MKKTLKEALNTAAKKWAKQEAAGDERVIEAYIKGAKRWMTNARKAIAEYVKDMTEALIDRNGAISPWEKLQIKKTARLWYNRDRLADELDMEESFMRLGQGSTKQLTEPIYFTPSNVWADIYQPDPSHAMANPPFDTNP